MRVAAGWQGCLRRRCILGTLVATSRLWRASQLLLPQLLCCASNCSTVPCRGIHPNGIRVRRLFSPRRPVALLAVLAVPVVTATAPAAAALLLRCGRRDRSDQLVRPHQRNPESTNNKATNLEPPPTTHGGGHRSEGRRRGCGKEHERPPKREQMPGLTSGLSGENRMPEPRCEQPHPLDSCESSCALSQPHQGLPTGIAAAAPHPLDSPLCASPAPKPSENTTAPGPYAAVYRPVCSLRHETGRPNNGGGGERKARSSDRKLLCGHVDCAATREKERERETVLA